MQAWLQSGKHFHIMHDHPTHYGGGMLAGMFGARAGALRHYPQLVPRVLDLTNPWRRTTSGWGVDQAFLQCFVWPMGKRSYYAHSGSPSKEKHLRARPFPPHPTAPHPGHYRACQQAQRDKQGSKFPKWRRRACPGVGIHDPWFCRR